MPTAAGLRYLEAGSGEPALVLLHAFPLHAGMWQRQLDGLSDGWRVIAPDLPAEPDMDAMADGVAALLDTLGIPQAVVGGLSMGGYVTLAFARRHRARVQALVLADTRAGADTDEVRERRTNQQAQVAAEGTGPLVDAMLGSLLGAHTRLHRPHVVDRARRLMEGVPPDRVTAFLEAMKGRPDSTADLASFTVPALVLVGDEDTVTPPDAAREMAGRLPDARLAVIPEAGHLANLEAPDTFDAVLRSFLEGLS